jgi:hypothetical protein
LGECLNLRHGLVPELDARTRVFPFLPIPFPALSLVCLGVALLNPTRKP